MLGESTVTGPQPQSNGTCLLLSTCQQSSMIGNTSDPQLRCFDPMGFLFLLMCMKAMHSPWKSGFEFVSSPGLLVAWSFHDTEQWQWVQHLLSPWPPVWFCSVLLSLRLWAKCVQCLFCCTIFTLLWVCWGTTSSQVEEHLSMTVLNTAYSENWCKTSRTTTERQKVFVRVVMLPWAGNCKNCHLSLCGGWDWGLETM